LRVYNSVSGTILGNQLTRPCAHAHTTCRNGLFGVYIIAIVRVIWNQRQFSDQRRL